VIPTEKLHNPIVKPENSLSGTALNYVKTFFTWNGRDVTHLKDEDFLSRDNWENNLKLFSEMTAVTPVAVLMTKKIYQWLPANSPLAEGYSNIKAKFNALSAESYARWLKIGAAAGVTFFFIRAMHYNLNCLDKYEIVTQEAVRECRIQFGEFLNQPGWIAQVVVVGGAWAFAGWLIQSFGDFGLRGAVAQYFLNKDLAVIYKTTADSARHAFWEAIDRGDEESAYKIHAQALKIKALSPYLKLTISRELNIDDAFFKKMMRPFELFIEDVSNYEKEKAAAVESTPPLVESKGLESNSISMERNA
jgi:hypothetical protein